LLLVLLYPRQLGWRLAVILVLLGALSFTLQQPAYVFEQYQRWFALERRIIGARTWISLPVIS
jgi:hypothetical protein